MALGLVKLKFKWLFWKGIKKVTKGKLLGNKDILYRKPYHIEYMLGIFSLKSVVK